MNTKGRSDMKNRERVTFEQVKNPQQFRYDSAFLEEAVSSATDQILANLSEFVHDYPMASSENLIYGKQKNGNDWVEGFWTGMLWASYELTGNELFRAVAEAQYDDYKERLDKFQFLSHHDIGFIYTPSIVAQYKVTGAEKAKELGLRAAEQLAKRFSEGAGIIQVRDWNPQGTFIIDCSMNIPLLFWAAQTTGDHDYYRKALSHITQVCNYMIRDDASTYQIFQIDELTGEPGRGSQGQGYNDDSCWSRGQSWVIYGLALAYRYTLDPEFLEMGKRVANYSLNRLPSDHVCTWDFIFTGDDDARDSSAAPVIACGLLELAEHLPDEDEHKLLYRNAAGDMMMHLAQEYRTTQEESNGLLKHGVYVKTTREGQEGDGLGDDECCIWGDYYYMEGLLRLTKKWNPYW